jgi:bifunctional non-homologous end joining protein LigD
MKATLVEHTPVGEGWMYELKWDGYRVLALKNGAEVELLSRNNKPLSTDFPEVVAAVKQLPVETALLDGEVCALDDKGRPRFQLLQGREMGESRPPMYYYVFDLLQQDVHSLLERPLMERKRALEKLLAGAPPAIRYSAPIEGRVEDLLEAVRQQGLEGLIGKAIDSPYRPGQRSREWVKLKVSQEQEFVIGGFTPPKGARKHLGALLLGYFEGDELHFAGKVGTGFNEAWLKRLSTLFAQHRAEANPFIDLQKYGNPRWGQGMTAAEIRQCKWLQPELVAQVKFAEWTDDGLLRHAVFLGMREDKAARDVGRAG